MVDGQQVTVLTDNKALTALHMSAPSKRLSRWSERLQDYDAEIKHLASQSNELANTFSRNRARRSSLSDGLDSYPDRSEGDRRHLVAITRWGQTVRIVSATDSKSQGRSRPNSRNSKKSVGKRKTMPLSAAQGQG